MLVLFLSSTAFMARAQNGVEISDTVFSEILNEKRAIDIRLQKGIKLNLQKDMMLSTFLMVNGI
jgi:hypothetical protein